MSTYLELSRMHEFSDFGPFVVSGKGALIHTPLETLRMRRYDIAYMIFHWTYEGRLNTHASCKEYVSFCPPRTKILWEDLSCAEPAVAQKPNLLRGIAMEGSNPSFSSSIE